MERWTTTGIWRLSKILGAIALALAVAFVLFYSIDRYWRPSTGYLDREIQLLEQKVRGDPQNLALRLSLAKYYASRKQLDAAESQFQEVLKAAPGNQEATSGLALVYYRKGQLQDAAQYMNLVVERGGERAIYTRDPLVQAAHYYLGKIYLDQRKNAEAIEELKKALQLNRADADTLYLLGQAFQRTGDCSSGAEAYKVALAFVPDFREAYQGLEECSRSVGDEAVANYAGAMYQLFSGSPDKAISRLQELTRSQPGLADARWGLGYAYQTIGQKDKAIAAYRDALSADPEHRLAKSALKGLGVEVN